MGVRGKGVGSGVSGWRFGVSGWRFKEATAGAMGATWAEPPPHGERPQYLRVEGGGRSASVGFAMGLVPNGRRFRRPSRKG